MKTKPGNGPDGYLVTLRCIMDVQKARGIRTAMTAKELYDLLCRDPLTDLDTVTLCRIVMDQEREIEDIRNWIRQPTNYHEDNPTV